jgi:hypothetical protein
MKKHIFSFLVFATFLFTSFMAVVYGKKGDSLKPTELPQFIPYSKDSPFNQKIAKKVEIDPDTEPMVKSMIQVKEKKEFVIAVKNFTVPVYFADSKTRRYRVRLTADWAPAAAFKDIPIPDHAEPDTEDDGHMVVIDKSTGCEYDFWQAKKENGEWKASWANSIHIKGTGVYATGNSCRGSGFGLLAGVIWPHELRKGYIPHALLVCYTHPKAGGPVPPATESDGKSTIEGAIPEGARIQLHPRLDLSQFKLTPYEFTIAKCMQEYGMIMGDVGEGIQLFAINPISVQGNPYQGVLPNEEYVHIPNIPFKYFRVLKMSPQIKNPKLYPSPAPNCGKMEYGNK